MNREYKYEQFSNMVKSFCSVNKLKLMAIIFHEPGLTGIDLVNRLYSESTTTYNHLKALKKYNLITSVQSGRAIKYYFNDELTSRFFNGFYELMEAVPGSDKGEDECI